MKKEKSKVNKFDPMVSKSLQSSKKFWIAALFLIVAILMQVNGHFDANFANFMMWFGGSTVFSFSIQDVGQAACRKKNDFMDQEV
jgi:hypothetical protein